MDDLIFVHWIDNGGMYVGGYQLLVLLSTGSGFKAVEIPSSCHWGGYVGDYDGDGLKDYICWDFENGYVLRGNGSESLFDEEVKLPGVGYIFDSSAEVFDIEGDGKDDLVYISGGQDSVVLKNLHRASIIEPGDVRWVSAGFEVALAPPVTQCSPSAEFCTFPDEYTQSDQTGMGYHLQRNMAVLDVNGDGLKDVYYTGPRAGDSGVDADSLPVLFLNTGKGFKASSISVPPGTRFSWTFPVVYDYDNDGREDLVDPDYGFMLRSTQRGTLEHTPIAEKYVKAKWDPGEMVRVADLNGDGAPDWYSTYGTRWADPHKNGKLALIRDSLGKAIEIEYDQIYEQASPYVLAPPMPDSEVTQLRRISPLVSKYRDFQIQSDDSWVQNGSHLFQYFGANVGWGGRGWYGFGHIEEQVLDSPEHNVFRKIDTYYHNTEFWNAGRVREIHDLSGGAASSDWHSGYRRELVTTNTWSQHITSVGNELFTALMHKDTTLWEGEVALWDAFTRYMYLDGIGNVTYERTETTIAGAQSPTDVRRHDYSYTPDLSNWLVANPVRVSDSSTINGVEETHTTAYTYYPNGLVRTVTREPDAAEYTLTNTYTRDTGSNVVTRIDSTDSAGNRRSARIDYDSEKRYPTHYVREKTEDGLALDTEVAFDPRTGQLQTSMDPNGVVTQWQYDAFGRIRGVYTPTETANTTYVTGAPYLWSVIGVVAMSESTVVTGTGESKLFVSSLDCAGRVKATVQSGAKNTYLFQEFKRDWAGRVVKATVPHLSGDTSQGAYSYAYDGLGRVASVTAPDQRVTKYDYISRASARSSQDALFADPNDSSVEARLRIEPNGLLEATVFNHRGQPVRVAQSPKEANVSAADIISGTAGTTNHFEYGVFGRLSETTDPDGETTAITYDRVGRRLSIGNETIGTTAFSYNAFDEVTGELQADGTRHCYEHDSLGRIVELTKAGADGSCSTLGSLIASWTYDGAGDNELGKLVSSFRASNPGSASRTTMRYHYEPKLSGSAPSIGRLQSVEQEIPDLQSPLAATAEYSGPWLSKLHYPRESGSDFAITFTRDSIGTVTSVARDGATDAAPYWELTAVDQGQRIASEQFGSGTITSYDYFAPGSAQDQCNHPSGGSCMPGALQALSTVLPSGMTATDLQYHYDNSGNLSSSYSDPQTSQQYSYDVYGRLIVKANFDGGGRGETTYWSFTPGGDVMEVETGDPRSAKPPVLHSYAYDTSRRHVLLGLLDTAGNTQTVTPDPKGNIIGRSGWNTPNGSQTFEYNEANLPTAIRGGIGGDTLFDYNTDLQRVAKRGPVETTLYMDDLFECVGSSTPPGSAFGCSEQRFKIFAGSRQVAVVSRDLFGNDKTNYIHTDHLGSGTVITDAEGNVTERRKYDAFGQITTDSDMTLSPVKAGYTGHEHDAELGLVNMKGRIYDPFTRRFLTPDPYVTEPLNPQGLNRFSYVKNNPLNLVDPTGFSGEGGGCDNNCGGGPEGGIVTMPEIVITASAPTTYVNTNANVNQSSSGSFNANGFSASGFNISSLGEGTGNSSGSGNAAISDGRMTGGYYSPQMSGGDNRGGDFQAVANQNPSSNPQAGTETGSTQQPTDNRTASPAPETSGSNRAWVGARIASAAIPFASSVMTMNDPNATDEEKGEALIWTLVDAATLGVGHAVAAIVQLGRAAKSGKTALTAAHLGLSGKGIAKLTGTVVDAGSTRIINVGYIEATSRGALTGEARTAFSNMLSSARAEGIQTLQINATFANAGLQEFAASMAAQYGGTFSSAGGVETLTFMLK